MGSENDTKERFLECFIPVQASIYAYIRAAGVPPSDAEDALQDLASRLWKNFSAYDPDRPFVAWAIGVARNLIRDRRRRAKVRQRVCVNSEMCERLADEVADTLVENQPLFESEREHLEPCLRELPEKATAVLRLCYFQNLSLADLARRIRKTYAAANMLLSRSRFLLVECIQRKTKEHPA